MFGRRIRHLLYVLGMGGIWHPILHIVGLPGHLSDAATWLSWLGWLKVNAPTVDQALLLVVSTTCLLLASSNHWWPRVTGRHRLRRLAPLIEEIIQLKEIPEDPDHPSGVAMERTWRLDAELHKLAILHPDLRPMEGRVQQASFLVGLLVSSNRSDLKRARSLYRGRLADDMVCEWEPQS